MKVCPKCNQSYDDANLNFCLNDGEMLMETDSQDAPPTIMMDSPRQTNENWGNFDTEQSEFNQPNQQANQPNQQVYQPPFATPQGTNYSGTGNIDQTLPIISLITGIMSLFLVCCLGGFLFGPIGLITGYIGMNNANKNPGVYGGKTLAIVGMVLGGIGLVLSALYILLQILGSIA